MGSPPDFLARARVIFILKRDTSCFDVYISQLDICVNYSPYGSAKALIIIKKELRSSSEVSKRITSSLICRFSRQALTDRLLRNTAQFTHIFIKRRRINGNTFSIRIQFLYNPASRLIITIPKYWLASSDKSRIPPARQMMGSGLGCCYTINMVVSVQRKSYNPCPTAAPT